MRIVKHLLTYLFWTMLSLLMGIVYMRLLLGDIAQDESIGGFGYLLKVFYLHGLFFIGLPFGAVIALLFIATDWFFLSKKRKPKVNRTLMRIALLLTITVFVAIVHYVLEVVIDVI